MNDLDPQLLRAAKVLSATAYTGLVLLLPPALARSYWDKVTHLTDEFVGRAINLWADETDDALHLLNTVAQHAKGLTA